ncbi:uncharacterized protein LOC144629068 [Oculina patagonica]
MKELEIALCLFMFLRFIGEKTSFGSELGIQREEGKRFAFFREVKQGAVLEGHVISTYLVFSELDCLHKCLSCSKCASFNFQLFDSGLRHICQLNDVTQSLSGHALTFRDGFSYHEPVVLLNELQGQDRPSGIIDDVQNPAASTTEETSSMTSPALLAPSSSSIVELPMTSSPVLDVSTSPMMASAIYPVTSPTALSATLPMTSPAILDVSTSPMMASAIYLVTSPTLPTALSDTLPMTSSAILDASTSPIMTSEINSMTSPMQMPSSSTNLLASSSVAQVADCINGWQQYRTGCIKYFTASLTRSKAHQQCAGYKTSSNVPGKLVKIPSSADNDHLVSLAPQAGRYYIGLTDGATEGVYRWKWNKDDATFFNWMSGYPQEYNIEKNRDCVVLYTHSDSFYKKWTTVECSNSWSYICECESACS